MSDMLSIIAGDGAVIELVGDRFGKAGLEALHSVTGNSQAIPLPKGSKPAKASKAVTKKAQAGKATRKPKNSEPVAAGTVFLHKGRDGERKLTAQADGSFKLDDGTKHESLTAAAKAVTGAKSINGRAYWKVA